VRQPIALLLIAYLLGPSTVSAQSSNTDSLRIIGDFADRLCQTVPLGSTAQSLELSGAAKAELQGVLKQLANLGVAGAAKYSSASSQNVLQRDLAQVLNDSRNCRLQVWNDLKDKFEIGAATSARRCVAFPGSDVCTCIVDANAGWKGPGQPICPTDRTSGPCRCPTPQGVLNGTVKFQ
jgi:hypothetical protein